jgi:hypothetical protein
MTGGAGGEGVDTVHCDRAYESVIGTAAGPLPLRGQYSYGQLCLFHLMTCNTILRANMGGGVPVHIFVYFPLSRIFITRRREYLEEE